MRNKPVLGSEWIDKLSGIIWQVVEVSENFVKVKDVRSATEQIWSINAFFERFEYMQGGCYDG